MPKTLSPAAGQCGGLSAVGLLVLHYRRLASLRRSLVLFYLKLFVRTLIGIFITVWPVKTSNYGPCGRWCRPLDRDPSHETPRRPVVKITTFLVLILRSWSRSRSWGKRFRLGLGLGSNVLVLISVLGQMGWSWFLVLRKMLTIICRLFNSRCWRCRKSAETAWWSFAI